MSTVVKQAHGGEERRMGWVPVPPSPVQRVREVAGMNRSTLRFIICEHRSSRILVR